MRQLSHAVIAVAFWVLLAALWVELALEGKATRAALRNTAFELAALAGVVLAVTLWWVRHNVGIYTRKGPRRGRAEAAPDTGADRLGRPVRWAMPGGARTAAAQRHLVVDVDGEVKTYHRGG